MCTKSSENELPLGVARPCHAVRQGSRERQAVVFGLMAMLVLSGTTSRSAAAERVALVVGNSAYEEVVGLPNPVNDATDVSAALGRLGFDVTLLLNATRDAIADALITFAHASRDADISLLFYAGHGLETAEGHYYLMPVDALVRSPSLTIRFDSVDPGDPPEVVRPYNDPAAAGSVSLNTVLGAMSGARVLIVILDSARDDPFEQRRDTTGGLVFPETGVLIAYSTLPGSVADDGSGRNNSPYTEALLAHLEEPGVELEVMFRRVAAAASAGTDGRQQPMVVTTLTEPGPIRLAGPRQPQEAGPDGP